MTDAAAKISKTPLGVGSIISESFSILFGNFISVIILGFMPILLGLLISALLVGWNIALGIGDPQFANAGGIAAYVLSVLVNLVIFGVMTALLVQLAYDAKLKKPLRLGHYISPAISAALPIAILGLVTGILVAFASIALIIPGLWVYAVFSVTAPAVVIDRVGYGGLRRSAALTKEYRWPILGALILIGICTWIINFVAAFIIGIFGEGIGVGIFPSVILYSALSALAYGLGGIAAALIYARLREIKEGVSVDEIVSVFE